MTPEFSRPVDPETISESLRVMEIGADEAERAALAKRFGLPRIDRLSARMRLQRRAGIIHADGHVEAGVLQACVVTGDPMPASIDAPFSVRFVSDALARNEEDVELTPEDCDTLPIENGEIDLGELAAETLALALDPFPRSEGADGVLRESGVMDEAEIGPFAALKALKERLEKGS